MVNKVIPIRFWCHKVLPLVYDDALSYYEVVCKVSEKLNEVIENDSEQIDSIEDLKTAVQELDGLAEQFGTDIDNLKGRMSDAETNIQGIGLAVESISENLTALEYKVRDCFNIIAPQYSEDRKWYVGQFCIYENAMYKCTLDTNDPAGSWDWDYWTVSGVANELFELRNLYDSVFTILENMEIRIMQNIAPPFRNYEGESFSYFTGDIVSYLDYVYECILGYTVSSVVEPPINDSAHWSRTTIGGIVTRDTRLATRISQNIASEYNAGNTYNTGDYCMYDNTLYKCLYDNITGAWDNTKWVMTNVADNLGSGGSGTGNVYVPEWDSTKEYIWGEFVEYNGDTYMCIVGSNTTSSIGSFVSTEWTVAKPMQEVTSSRRIETLDTTIFDEDNQDAIGEGSLVIFRDANGVQTLYHVDIDGATSPIIVGDMSPTNILSELNNVRATGFGNFVDTFDSSETYNKGDIILYHDNILVCKNDNVTGTWNVSDWSYGNTVISVLASLAKKMNSLSVYQNDVRDRLSDNVREAV